MPYLFGPGNPETKATAQHDDYEEYNLYTYCIDRKYKNSFSLPILRNTPKPINPTCHKRKFPPVSILWSNQVLLSNSNWISRSIAAGLRIGEEELGVGKCIFFWKENVSATTACAWLTALPNCCRQTLVGSSIKLRSVLCRYTVYPSLDWYIALCLFSLSSYNNDSYWGYKAAHENISVPLIRWALWRHVRGWVN